MIITDSVFSMDGDRAPCVTSSRWRVPIMQACSGRGPRGGVLGPRGAGLAERTGSAPRSPVQMGTLGKALGGAGAYVAGSGRSSTWWRTEARRLHLTGLARARSRSGAALRLVAAEPERRARLLANAARLRRELTAVGLRAEGDTHIIPVMLGDNALAMRFADALLDRGVLAHAIRPPTVPPGTAPPPRDTDGDAHRRPHRPGTRRVRGSRSRDRRDVMTDNRTLVEWDHRHIWHPFTQMADWLGRSRSSSRRGGGLARRYARAALLTACRRSGATCRARHPEPGRPRCAPSSSAWRTPRCSASAAFPPSSWLALWSGRPGGLTRCSPRGRDRGRAALRIALQYHQLRGTPVARAASRSGITATHAGAVGRLLGRLPSLRRERRPARDPPDAAVRLPLAAAGSGRRSAASVEMRRARSRRTPGASPR